MKTDIEIAQEAVMEPITNVAAGIGIDADDLELYGKYKAKLSEEFLEKIQARPNGKLILVTAINPTPAGEGKTTTTVGLGEAFGRMGKKAVIALREPSLGPCFGIKGGAAGGGYAQVVPMEELNLHFTGDFHAITSANNLLAALLDNHIQQGNELGIDTRQIVWKRCEDMNDRVLRNIVVGLGNKTDGYVREDHFVITVASEIMAILCLADDMKDLKDRLSRIVVAYNYQGEPVTAGQLKAVGAMAISYCVFNLTSMGPFFALILAKDAFLESCAGYYGEEYIATLDKLTPSWIVLVLIALALVGGLLGGLFGRKILKKHFVKAGITA